MRSDINTVAGAQSNYAAWPSLNTCKPRSAVLASSHSARITPPAPPPLASIPRWTAHASPLAAPSSTFMTRPMKGKHLKTEAPPPPAWKPCEAMGYVKSSPRALAAAALGETHGDEEETARGEWKRMGAVLMREPL
ncbi:unnamed protein product [Arctogadus glacialis]